MVFVYGEIVDGLGFFFSSNRGDALPIARGRLEKVAEAQLFGEYPCTVRTVAAFDPK